MSHPKFVVIGSGMAAFGAAYRLHSDAVSPVMFDKNTYHGGHTTSFKNDGGFPSSARTNDGEPTATTVCPTTRSAETMASRAAGDMWAAAYAMVCRGNSRTRSAIYR